MSIVTLPPPLQMPADCARALAAWSTGNRQGLIPAEQRKGLRHAIANTLSERMGADRSRRGATTLIGCYPVLNAPDPERYASAVASVLAEHSASVALEAIHDLVRSRRYPPSAAEVVEACRAVVLRRREMMATLDAMAAFEAERDRERDRRRKLLAAFAAHSGHACSWCEFEEAERHIERANHWTQRQSWKQALAAGDGDALQLATRAVLLVRIARRHGSDADFDGIACALLRGEHAAVAEQAGSEPAPRAVFGWDRFTRDADLALSDQVLAWPLARSLPKVPEVIDTEPF